MDNIQEIFEFKKENLEEAVALCVDELGPLFTMQTKENQFKILLVIGKYHLKQKEK